MLAVISSDFGWLLIAGICAWAVVMCLKVISRTIDHSATVHNLKVEVRALREAQRARLREIQAAEIVSAASRSNSARLKQKLSAASGAEDEASRRAGDDDAEKPAADPGAEQAAVEDAATARAA